MYVTTLYCNRFHLKCVEMCLLRLLFTGCKMCVCVCAITNDTLPFFSFSKTTKHNQDLAYAFPCGSSH